MRLPSKMIGKFNEDTANFQQGLLLTKRQL